MRPISNVVDITNYVMLLTGQPLHAFDLDRVAGAQLTVRRARAGETVEALDGTTDTLSEGMVVICDDDGPTSLAGVMGGARSEVGPSTTRVLLEAATWDGATVQRTAVALGRRSEASGRFEKGLSRLSPLEGQIVASALFIQLCGARLLPGTIDVGGPGPDPPPITLRPARLEKVLGVAIPAERCREILTSLGFEVDEGLRATVPHFRRGDVTREIDLIEEVARIEGLDRLPATLPPRTGVAGRLTHAQRVRRLAEDALAARGLCEIAGWTFADPAVLDRLRLPAEHPMRRTLSLSNPLSESLSMLRPTLLVSLLDAAAHNAARGASELALFESGAVFRADAEEHHGLAVLLTADFFAAKALLGATLGAVGVQWSVERSEDPFLHPGRAASVIAGGGRIGFLGELHPLVGGRVGSRPRLGLGGRPRPRRGARSRRRRVRPVRAVPARPRGPRRRRRRLGGGGRGGRRDPVSRRRRARLGRDLRRLPRCAGGGGACLARAAPRVPRGRPHAHRRGGGGDPRARHRRARGDRRDDPCLA